MRYGLLIILVFSIYGLASAQTDVCYVARYERDLKTKKQASARIVFGDFKLESENPTTKLFQDWSGVIIALRVERTPRKEIRLAISSVEKPDNVFSEVDSAEAESKYDENWRFLQVSKNLKVADHLYTYIFRCLRDNGKRRIIHHATPNNSLNRSGNSISFMVLPRIVD
jgi:hypothetical protein